MLTLELEVYVPITTRTIIAAFRDNREAEAAAADVKTAGIPSSDIYLETASASQRRCEQHEAQQGGIAGWFQSLFGAQDDSDRTLYENALRQGSTLLRVDVTDQQVSAVEAIVNRHLPVHIEAAGAGQVGAEGNRMAQTPASVESRALPKVIRAAKEQSHRGKRQVLRGGVRVYSRAVEEPVKDKISLREDSVRVERRPVNRAATDADILAGRQELVEVEELAEEPVISRQARVVEEVRVSKDISERTTTVRDTVRYADVTTGQASTGASGYGDAGVSFKLVFSQVPRDRIDQFVAKLGDLIAKNGGQLHPFIPPERDERIRVAASGPGVQKLTTGRT